MSTTKTPSHQAFGIRRQHTTAKSAKDAKFCPASMCSSCLCVLVNSGPGFGNYLVLSDLCGRILA